eukprot:COSAG02_NODE_1370_length_13018_cov_50.973218_8_plen_44_part_00
MKSAGEIDDEGESEDDDAVLLGDEGSASDLEPEPEPEPELEEE